MFWRLIDPNITSFFITFLEGGTAIATNSFLFWLLLLLGILLSVSVHEFAHAYTAYKLGDNTPYLEGRLTLNPFKHFDLLGLALIMFTSFGYGKPVPVNPENLNKRSYEIYIALMGPASNIAISATCGLIYIALSKYFTFNAHSYDLTNIVLATISSMIHTLPHIGILNIALAVFNLLPIPPLDGSKIWLAMVPNLSTIIDRYVYTYAFILILIVIMPIWNGISILSLLIAPLIFVYAMLIGMPLY